MDIVRVVSLFALVYIAVLSTITSMDTVAIKQFCTDEVQP